MQDTKEESKKENTKGKKIQSEMPEMKNITCRIEALWKFSPIE